MTATKPIEEVLKACSSHEQQLFNACKDLCQAVKSSLGGSQDYAALKALERHANEVGKAESAFRIAMEDNGAGKAGVHKHANHVISQCRAKALDEVAKGDLGTRELLYKKAFEGRGR